jgi:hypothetical protein
MEIFGKEIAKSDLLRKIGDITQIGEIKSYEFNDGLSKGIRAVDIRNCCGINMTILLDRAIDISFLSYKSIPISFRSKIKETSPEYYESKGDEWLRTFYGGLLTTCGLTYMGDPCVDNGEELGLHGRISNIRAENFSAGSSWTDDSYVMWVMGKIRESKFFGYYLELSRKITTWMNKTKILVEDTVENIGFKKSPLMILYHVNIGYPVLDSTSELIEARANVTPMNKISEKEIDRFNKFEEPVSGFEDRVYYHDIEADIDGNSNVAIINQNFYNGNGLGLWIKFNKDNLPNLVQWKHMENGEYVCGVEPCNSLIRGRNIEKKEGMVRFIEPGERINYRVEFNILTSNEDIEDFKSKFC